MDHSARIGFPAPSISQQYPLSATVSSGATVNSQQYPTPSQTNPPLAPTRELHGRIDQTAFLNDTLQAGASPSLVAGLAMVISQMRSQVQHPDLTLTITSGVERSAAQRRFMMAPGKDTT